MLRKFSCLLLVFCTFELSGCASNAAVDQMVYTNTSNGKPKISNLTNNIAISNVAGGHETNPLWTSQINNENFKTALEQSLKIANLYHKFNGEKYQLNANLIKLDQPFLGLDLKVTCTVHYTLEDIKLHKEIYNKVINSSYTATFSDSAIAITRLKMANEGAARENIKQLIEDLYRL